MSRLDELIQELCPEGVEYKNVGDLANISRGRVMSKDYIAENAGEYPVYSSQTENDGELGKISTYDFEGEYLTWTTDGANAGQAGGQCAVRYLEVLRILLLSVLKV